MIRVVNFREKLKGEYVGRPSVLGNRFLIGRQHTRHECIDLYRSWLRAEWKNGSAVKEELLRLARTYRERGELTLVCWCAPSACHADVIKEAIEALVQKGVAQ